MYHHVWIFIFSSMFSEMGLKPLFGARQMITTLKAFWNLCFPFTDIGSIWGKRWATLYIGFFCLSASQLCFRLWQSAILEVASSLLDVAPSASLGLKWYYSTDALDEVHALQNYMRSIAVHDLLSMQQLKMRTGGNLTSLTTVAGLQRIRALLLTRCKIPIPPPFLRLHA